MSRQAEDVFNDALEKTGAERQRFLAEACAGDPDLLREVTTLLDAYEAGDGLLPTLPPGVPVRIGGYPIVAEAARGGMGVVYLAEDERLHRRVALKLLPDWLARDPTCLEHFRREGRTLASIDHPNIATVHSLEEVDGVHFLTMEWVEGATLAEHIGGKPLPADQALAICLQIGRALEAAHARGVAHRDLKPLNVMVKPDGTVKVLDFGLAKAFGEAGREAATEADAKPGASLAAGTPGYMAPEQVLGGSADHRSDIWAFGCILHEVFTGRPVLPAGVRDPAASGSTPTPNLDTLRKVAPAPIVGLAERALEPDRERRLSDMGEVCRVLEAELAVQRRRQRWFGHSLVPALAGTAALIVLVALRGNFGSLSGRAPDRDLRLDRGDQIQITYTGSARMPEISADGRALAWIDGGDALTLWVQTLPEGTPRYLHRFWTVTDLRWSPDNRTLLVAGQAAEASSMGILLLDATDGTVRGQFDFDRHIAWAPDGRRFASAEENGRLQITDVATGATETLLRAPPWDQVFDLDWSPAGPWLVVSARGGAGLWIVAIGERRAIPIAVEDEFWSPRWTLHGAALLVIGKHEDVWQLRVDPRSGQPIGEPEHVLALSGLSSFNISCTASGGRIVYTRGPGRANMWLLDLETGATTQLSHGTLDHRRTRFSPDGRQILFTRRVIDAGADAFVVPVTGGEPVRLTSYQRCSYAVWSPDGRRIAFTRADKSKMFICVAAADGSAVREFEAARTADAIAWAPSDRIAFTAAGNHAIQELDVDTGAVREVYNSGPDSYVWQPQWSPGGRRLAVLETSIRGPDRPRVLVIDPRTGTRSVAHVGLATPAGWSRDGRWLHVVERRRAPGGDSAADAHDPTLSTSDPTPSLVLLRVPERGGAADTLGILPHLVELWSSVDVDPDGRRVVYTASDFLADIWLVEATDGQSERPGP